MDAITQVPAPHNEPVLNYAPGSPERAALETRLAELAADRLELTATIGGRQRMAAGEKFEVVQPHRHAAVLGTSAHATHGDAEDAVRCAKEAAPGWARALLRRPRRRLPQGRRPARRAVAADAQRRDHARAEQDRLPGRDRRGLRADRLLALQRALRPADPGRAAGRRPRASGTASTTGRSRASSTRSRRSTSPRSPATCRPRRRSWATPWSGSRRRPSSSPRTS